MARWGGENLFGISVIANREGSNVEVSVNMRDFVTVAALDASEDYDVASGASMEIIVSKGAVGGVVTQYASTDGGRTWGAI